MQVARQGLDLRMCNIGSLIIGIGLWGLLVSSTNFSPKPYSNYSGPDISPVHLGTVGLRVVEGPE